MLNAQAGGLTRCGGGKFSFKAQGLYFLAMALTWIAVSRMEKIYLAIDEDSVASDGYASQVAFILNLIENEGNLFQVEPLYWIHGLRTAVAIFFDYVEGVGGPALGGALVLGLALPVMLLFRDAKRPYLGALIPFAMLGLSYRAVLVLLSIGYLMIFILKNRSSVYLWVSFILANLSSGSVLSATLIAALIGLKYCRGNIKIKVYIGFLLFSLGVSALDKYIGFMAGDAGYDATVSGLTGWAALISRSTIFVSILEGDYLRAGTYIALFFTAICGFFHVLGRRRSNGYALIFFATIPAFLLEGLGVISLVVPILLFLSGIPLPSKPVFLPHVKDHG